MNEFKESLKVEIGNMEDIPVYDNGTFKQRVAINISEAIKNTKVYNDKEMAERIEYMLNINKILDHYEELRPILAEYFKNEKWEER